MALRRFVCRWYAKAINDKRSEPEYSWGWLNLLAEELIWKNRGAQIRPQYAWGAVMAAAQARALGHNEMALIEFGVAGGRGLLALEDIAAEVSQKIGPRLQVIGFDTGAGLPEVTDPRDLPQHYKRGDFSIEMAALRARLRPDTRLIIGEVRETLDDFLLQTHAPVGFISFDMDLYTSTRDALENCLPRVVCYFDDIMGVTFADINGERLAISEYNRDRYPLRSISPVFGLRYQLGWPHSRAQWPDMMFWAHFLDHAEYVMNDGLAPVAHAPL
jgi:hypothetical protein